MSTQGEPLTVLMQAVQKPNNIEEIQTLLSQFDINEQIDKVKIDAADDDFAFFESFNPQGFSVLMSAALIPNNEANIQFLLEKGASLSLSDKNNKTAFDYALALNNNEKVLKLFLERDRTLNLNQLIKYAKIPNSQSILATLLKLKPATIDVNLPYLKAAIRESIANQRAENFEFLIRYGEQNKLLTGEYLLELINEAAKQPNSNQILNNLIKTKEDLTVAINESAQTTENTENLTFLFSHALLSPDTKMSLLKNSLTVALKVHANEENVNFIITEIQKLDTHFDLIPFLTEALDTIQASKGQALYKANTNIMTLLNNIVFPIEDDNTRLQILDIVAATPKNQLLLEKLINNESDLQRALNRALQNEDNADNVLFIASLADSFPKGKLEIDYLKMALMEALQNAGNLTNFTQILNEINRSYPPPLVDMNAFLLKAAINKQSNHQEKLKILLAEPYIDIDACLTEAVSVNHNYKNIEAILQHPAITAKSIRLALFESIKITNTYTIQQLLTHPLLTSEDINKALIFASQIPNNSDNIKLLLGKPAISPQSIEKALEFASQIPNNRETLDVLLSKPGINPNVLSKVMNNREHLNDPSLYATHATTVAMPKSTKWETFNTYNPINWLYKAAQFVITNAFALAFTLISAPFVMVSKMVMKEPPSFLWAFGAIGKIVLPAQVLYDTPEKQLELELARESAIDRYKANNKENEKLTISRLKIATYDGAVLDTTEIRQKNKDPKNQKYIIRFLGNAQAHNQSMDEFLADAERLNCNVVAFDYRGVARSQGFVSSKDKLVIDGIAQVQRLLDNGVKPQNITLEGHSLGGAVATLVAKHFYDHGIKLYLFNGRSFSTLTNAACGLVEIRAGRVASALSYLVIKPTLELAGWEMDAASAFKALPAQNKDYVVAKASKAVIKERREQLSKEGVTSLESFGEDGIIHHRASLHAALKEERQQEKKEIEDFLKKENVVLPQDKLKAIKNRHKMHADLVYSQNEKQIAIGGHNVSLTDITDRSGQLTGQDFFDNFFKHQGQAKTISHIHPNISQWKKEYEQKKALENIAVLVAKPPIKEGFPETQQHQKKVLIPGFELKRSVEPLKIPEAQVELEEHPEETHAPKEESNAPLDSNTNDLNPKSPKR